jgi:hypothetical protein
MTASVVLVDRDPLYAWFVTEALSAADTPVTWFRDAASAVENAPETPASALLLVDGVTWLTASRGAAATADAWPRAVLIGWDPRTTPPAGFVALDDKPDDAGDLRALVAGALAAAPVARGGGLAANGAG